MKLLKKNMMKFKTVVLSYLYTCFIIIKLHLASFKLRRVLIMFRPE